MVKLTATTSRRKPRPRNNRGLLERKKPGHCAGLFLWPGEERACCGSYIPPQIEDLLAFLRSLERERTARVLVSSPVPQKLDNQFGESRFRVAGAFHFRPPKKARERQLLAVDDGRGAGLLLLEFAYEGRRDVERF